MRAGDRAHAQQAYYVFEELAGSIATLSAASLVGQAVAEVHLGRLPEAAQALEQALAMEGEGEGVRAGALVDRAVLDVLLAKGYEGSFG